MNQISRRQFLGTTVARAGSIGSLSLFPSLMSKALAVEASRITGTIRDVEHIVVLTQENRSFDHYFGSMAGVRGFSDPFPVPVVHDQLDRGGLVWQQPRLSPEDKAGVVLPFHLNTKNDFALMRGEGTPHTWQDAQMAWDQGRMNQWTRFKSVRAMGYYTQSDLPFHYALADAFTICDAYHCSFQGGTNTNRLFLWTGTNDPRGQGNGPATYNDLDSLKPKMGVSAYSWTTYPERLQAAGISWQIYQDMSDNYDNNPLAGFNSFRQAYEGRGEMHAELKARGLTTRDVDQLKKDVQANALPQVSWILAKAEDCEHPERSSPAQGAHFVARVLDALVANPEVWSRTVLIVNFDENDGFFDHIPPPAAPSKIPDLGDPEKFQLAGMSTVGTEGEYHEKLVPYHDAEHERSLLHRPYGLGPRVPMLAISPWSRGGWVNSEVFDHTSVIRFIERRFGVMEPNISAWRRKVCGDLTSVFDFSRADPSYLPTLPETALAAMRAQKLVERKIPVVPQFQTMPVQTPGIRRSCALPYQLKVNCHWHVETKTLQLRLMNLGSAAAVFHVYDRLHLSHIPRRFTVESGQHIDDSWSVHGSSGAYDLWLLGPGGFHRHFMGALPVALSAGQISPEIELDYNPAQDGLLVKLSNRGQATCSFELQDNAYHDGRRLRSVAEPQQTAIQTWDTKSSGNWYDFTVRVTELADFSQRFAGRMENGKHAITDPRHA